MVTGTIRRPVNHAPANQGQEHRLECPTPVCERITVRAIFAPSVLNDIRRFKILQAGSEQIGADTLERSE
jgi:hypothetical protein